jgi:hypothetical protein
MLPSGHHRQVVTAVPSCVSLPFISNAFFSRFGPEVTTVDVKMYLKEQLNLKRMVCNSWVEILVGDNCSLHVGNNYSSPHCDLELLKIV